MVATQRCFLPCTQLAVVSSCTASGAAPLPVHAHACRGAGACARVVLSPTLACLYRAYSCSRSSSLPTLYSLISSAAAAKSSCDSCPARQEAACAWMIARPNGRTSDQRATAIAVYNV